MGVMRADLRARPAPRRLRRRRRAHRALPRLDHRLDQRRRAAASSPPRGIAPPGTAPVRPAGPVPLQLGPTRRTAACPLCGSAGHRGAQRVRRDRLQGAAPLPVLPRAVRARQGDLMTTTRPGTARRRPQFHPLTVAKVEQLTDDAVAVTFDVPAELAEDYRFKPGPGAHPAPGRRRPRRAPLLLDLRADGRRTAGRRPRGARRLLLLLPGARGPARRRRSRCCRRRARSPPTSRVPGDHVFVVAGSGITPALSLAGIGAARRRVARSPSSTATGAPTR